MIVEMNVPSPGESISEVEIATLSSAAKVRVALSESISQIS